MISLAALGTSASAASYYSADNYYTADEARDASAWAGKGAEELGLSGPVDEAGFEQVLDGKLPDGSRIEAPNGAHRPGLDLTFSAPKSLSLVAMLGGDQRLIEALQQSATATLAWAEKNVMEARVWDPDLKRQVPERTGNMLAATFLHDINRNGEPQLHVHAVIANATLASDGKWHAVHNGAIFKAQHVLSAVHNSELRTRVEALGYETTPAPNPIDGAFEIKGVSRETIEAFSTRREEILEALAAGDRSSPRERELAALATRRGKEPERDRAETIASWRETARGVSFDPARVIDAAVARSEREQTIWTRVMQGVRGIGAKGLALASAMGLTPRDGDPLVPERMGRLDPQSFAAAQAVASGARELGEREAAFSRHDLIRTALEHQGPFTVATIEARIDHLQKAGLLLGWKRMLTTEQAVALEVRVIDLAREGRGAAAPIMQGEQIGAQLQQAARDLGLRRLTQGQERAGIDILSSQDRVHLVQGSAGVGKSAALQPVAAIARSDGRTVIALAHARSTARDFGAKIEAPAVTVDSFLKTYSGVLNGTASAERIEQAHEALSGALVMVDEASQIGTDRIARLIDLANRIQVGRLVLAGDVRQLPAIEAGRPFEQLQEQGQPTSHITENLRARSPQMQALNAALDDRDIEGAFKVLEPATREVAPGTVPQVASAMWANLPKEERDQTVLLASGRAMRTAGNAAAQAQLLAKGELGKDRIDLTVHDRASTTREGVRLIKHYLPERLVEFRTNLRSQGFARGEMGRVHEVRDGIVELRMPDGELRNFDPSRLPRNLANDAVSIFQDKQIALHEGDRVRWIDTDQTRGLVNGDIAHVTSVGQNGISIQTRDGESHDLARDDRMMGRVDLAYAVNAHIAQGITAANGIIMMSEREKALNSTAAFLVQTTRVAERVDLVVDNAAKIERDVSRNPGGKASAIDAVRGSQEKVAELERARDIDMGHGRSQDRDFDMDM